MSPARRISRGRTRNSVESERLTLAPGRQASVKSRPQRQQRPLVLEQPALPVDAAAEACEVAVGPDHAMARHDDGDGVLAVGRAYRPRIARVAQAAGDP